MGIPKPMRIRSRRGVLVDLYLEQKVESHTGLARALSSVFTVNGYSIIISTINSIILITYGSLPLTILSSQDGGFKVPVVNENIFIVMLCLPAISISMQAFFFHKSYVSRAYSATEGAPFAVGSALRFLFPGLFISGLIPMLLKNSVAPLSYYSFHGCAFVVAGLLVSEVLDKRYKTSLSKKLIKVKLDALRLRKDGDENAEKLLKQITGSPETTLKKDSCVVRLVKYSVTFMQLLISVFIAMLLIPSFNGSAIWGVSCT